LNADGLPEFRPPELRGELPSLAGCSAGEIAALLAPLPRFRAEQVSLWIRKGAESFGEMTNLPSTLQKELGERFVISGSAPCARLSDPDGTVKLQIRLRDGARIEAVLLVDGGGRKTACLSSQAGCPAGCVFCKTGSIPFRRNLSSGEIVEQFLHLGRAAGEKLDNIVIMGMGEPLFNLEELAKALRFFQDPEGFGLSPKRVTVSTSGVVSGIRKLADLAPRCRLAFSLATADEELRVRLMPITKSNPLKEVREALKYWQKKEGRRITLELVLLRGVNTRREDAEALGRFLAGDLDAAVNLIPWNPVPGMSLDGKPLREPEEAEIRCFQGELERRGIKFTRRRRRGRTVSGACGQLGVTEGPGVRGG
jgi:23S rRNA (adenine2503-C2)-methyltransferase